MKVLIAGDFCPHNRVAGLIEEGQFDKIWNDVPSITKDTDYCVLNLECPIVEHQASPIAKCGPNLKSSGKVVDAIKFAGFDCVTLANNHFYDYGEVGVNDTLTALQKQGIDFVGGGLNLKEASNTLYKEIKGKKLAVINCCEHEFSIATDYSGGSNPLNSIQQFYAIKEAKECASYVIVIVHGGFEHFQLPSTRMQETYRFFIDAGADAVVNHHQHCYSGYEVYKGKPIFYGLGNFCFDWNGKRKDKWNKGYIVKLSLDNKIEFELLPYIQCDVEPSVKLMEEKESFIEDVEILNGIISDSDKLKKNVEHYLLETSRNYVFCFEPFYNRLTKPFYEKGLIPSFIRRKRQALINFIGNESHYEKIMKTIMETFK